MYLNYANSQNESDNDNMNKNGILINSCGTYKLYTKAELPTFRHEGRNDYQIIYIAAGRGYFFFEETIPTVVEAGNMIFFRPIEPQRYIYYGKDAPEIYWIHFSGTNIEKMFQEYDIDIDKKTIYSGINTDYIHLFKMIIWELQIQKDYYQESAVLYFKQLLIMLGRFIHDNTVRNVENTTSLEIERATAYFYEHYRENINIDEYVKQTGLSISLFFRKFKFYTGLTPLQYLLDIRLANAKRLLESTEYSISEIAGIIRCILAGYFVNT